MEATEMDIDFGNEAAAVDVTAGSDQEMGDGSTQNNPSSDEKGSTAFPVARVKKIMKAGGDVNLVSAEAVHLTSLAAEMFLDLLVRRATAQSQNETRRTVLYKDFASAVKQDARFGFLQELIPETVKASTALEVQKSRGMATAITPSQSPASTPRKEVSMMDLADHFMPSNQAEVVNIDADEDSSASFYKSAGLVADGDDMLSDDFNQ